MSYVVNSAHSGLHSNCCIVLKLLVKLKILEKKEMALDQGWRY